MYYGMKYDGRYMCMLSYLENSIRGSVISQGVQGLHLPFLYAA